MGSIVIGASPAGLVTMRWSRRMPAATRGGDARSATACVRVLHAAEDWLRSYFSGQPPFGALPPLAAVGSPFQKEVWRRLLAIPFGETATYGEIARAIGKPGAARAVGQANGANPLPILVPCHRVVASGGKIGGYSSGLPRKRWLLAHEGHEGFRLASG